MKAINRVLQIIESKGVNNSTFEKQTGLSNGYLATQLKRNADLGESVLNKILNNSQNINPEWLLTGKGSMYRIENKNTSPDELASLNQEIKTLQSEVIKLQKQIIKMHEEQNAIKRTRSKTDPKSELELAQVLEKLINIRKKKHEMS